MIIVAFIAFVAMLFMPDASLKGAYSGTMMCIEKVIPALFPFFVCTGILTGSGVPQLLGKAIGKPFEKLFGINKNCAFAFITGLLCGYPLGAKVVGDMYQQKMCTKSEAQRMLSFCNNSGPLFIMGTVGTGILFSHKAGVVLYIAHILSAIVMGITVRFIIPVKKEDRPITIRTTTTSATLHTALLSSVKSIAVVCANIVFFSVIITAIKPIIAMLAPHHQGLMCGTIEITTGISSMEINQLPLIGFLLAWSGISVIMQVDSIISPLGLSTPLFALTKLIQGVIASLITWLIIPLSSLHTPHTLLPVPIVFIGAALITLCAISADKIKKSL